jgi:hypothetical protein
MRWLASFFLVVLFLSTSCGPREPVPSRSDPGLRAAPAPPMSLTGVDPELRNAPLEAVVQGVPLRIGAELWRDFMPVSPPEGRPLTGVVWIWAADRAAAGPVPKADRCWILRGDSAWLTLPMPEPPPSPSDSVLARYSLREGPLWGPGDQVDVVLRLVNEGGKPILIRAAGQEITRTD